MQAIELLAEVTKGHELHLHLPHNIQHGIVRVIVLYEQSEPQQQVASKRQFGQFKGQIALSEDFDDTLPNAFWLGDAS